MTWLFSGIGIYIGVWCCAYDSMQDPYARSNFHIIFFCEQNYRHLSCIFFLDKSHTSHAIFLDKIATLLIPHNYSSLSQVQMIYYVVVITKKNLFISIVLFCYITHDIIWCGTLMSTHCRTNTNKSISRAIKQSKVLSGDLKKTKPFEIIYV